MVAPNLLAPYVLNNYVWQLLQNNTSMKSADYGGRVPIVPNGDDADLTAYDKPYLVYGYAEDSTPDLYAIRGGSLSYAVFSTRGSEISQIMNIIRAAMERHDETARNVNEYTSTVPQFAGIRFGSITISYHEGPSPEETEGGRKSGVLVLRYSYFADYEVKTFPWA